MCNFSLDCIDKLVAVLFAFLDLTCEEVCFVDITVVSSYLEERISRALVFADGLDYDQRWKSVFEMCSLQTLGEYDAFLLGRKFSFGRSNALYGNDFERGSLCCPVGVQGSFELQELS